MRLTDDVIGGDSVLHPTALPAVLPLGLWIGKWIVSTVRIGDAANKKWTICILSYSSWILWVWVFFFFNLKTVFKAECRGVSSDMLTQSLSAAFPRRVSKPHDNQQISNVYGWLVLGWGCPIPAPPTDDVNRKEQKLSSMSSQRNSSPAVSTVWNLDESTFLPNGRYWK